jgi:menaquinone-dependent protoporphyrinogen oxidase
MLTSRGSGPFQKTLAIFYATSEGHTRRIAERLARRLRRRGMSVDVVDISTPSPAEFDLSRYAGAVLAASIHMGKHQRSMIDFVKTHRGAIERLPTTFLSVSLSQAAVEDPCATPQRKERAKREVHKAVEGFSLTTGWKPGRVHAVAGALLYRQYGVFLRLLMQFISSVVGASTDTSQNHEYTDWKAIERFADEMAADFGAQAAEAIELH